MFKKNWQKNKYINFVKDIITPRFLIDLIMPKEIFGFINSLNIKNSEESIYRFIIGCSVFNAVLVGMPDGIGILLPVAQAVEVLMAFHIARMVGLIDNNESFSLSKLTKLLSATVITSVTVLVLFKSALNIIFKFISNLSLGAAMPITATTALVTTLFYGLFIYLAFSEIKNFGKSKLSILSISKIAYRSFKYTIGISKSLIKLVFKDLPHLVKTIKDNIKDAFNVNETFKLQIKGEYFFAGSLAYVMMGKFDNLNGPFGKMYLDAWRMVNPTKLGDDATQEQIRDLANSYSAEELDNVKNNINSKFFEILQVTRENADGDEWSAELSDVQNEKGHDAIFTNNITGDTVRINYKFTSDINYIERHIQEHPDIPVVAPKDIQEKINSPFVSHVDSETVSEVTEENFDKFLNQYSTLDLAVGATAAGVTSYTIRLLPFFVGYYKGKITFEQLGIAIKKLFPDITSRTINRIGMLTFFGPLYGLFILSSFAMRGALYGFDDNVPKETSNIKKESEKKKEGLFEKKFSRRSLFTLSYLKDL